MDKKRIKEIVLEEKLQDVMERYYGIKFNKGVQLVESITLDRLINKHGANGYVALSACRVANGEEKNIQLTKDLISDIKGRGYGYLPTYGGYNDKENGGETADYEPSFIVFNYNRKGEKTDFADLERFACEMCGKYCQDSVMIAPPNQPPYYADCEGNKVSSKSSMDYKKNDFGQEYFTSLVPKEKVDANRRNGQPIGRRFTADIQFEGKVFINPQPQNLNEQRRRMNGEVMLVEDNGKKKWIF